MIRVGLSVLRKIYAEKECEEISHSLKDLYLLYSIDEAPKSLHYGEREVKQTKYYVWLILLTLLK